MAEQTGHSVAALQARQAALAQRHSDAADADRVLAETLATAHAVSIESISRLSAIAGEIENAVQNQHAHALDTPTGAREFQRFLIAKQREIMGIVARAHELDSAKRAELEALRPQYTNTVG